ncbi:class I SAM-dependent methyltransferase [Campylobacter hyointestinalis]|uniref:class I SAM-dependent methyltransferase n=1 Tax=Campylobacter hyointestinalis TaxID=198 RepID=UPI0009BF5375|nr:class I SAM-dependent methyltransferase [Campylobacter hyointestinalis]PPB53314.1 methyltransferase type 11 [Campylobacter hyointestinalis subsp. hyointestinalis]PPB55173.1 methyltransferase type 11 [Campylobacter hyointestinalis subsp. hyointestinalis]PPB66698.1 methyltransferase type 11 [Campylobacter hyointestinalis subsp. hyointestinalis]PPB68413.1 methyltransferase type 11 [Campylobacter hyointestinalis subsp. hyointestinalis]PPB74292.1 methyltransferase type 11 [Campylobacter hyointes
MKWGGVILDLGCGAGRHTKLLAENGFIAYGCDYSQSGVEVAKLLIKQSNLTANLRVASASDLPYENEKFDGIICWGVLEYIDLNSIEKASEEIYRVLKVGGKVLINVRNVEDYRYKNGEKISQFNVIVRENSKNNSAFKENGMPMYFFDKNEIKRVFSKFNKIKIDSLSWSCEDGEFVNSDYIVILEK